MSSSRASPAQERFALLPSRKTTFSIDHSRAPSGYICPRWPGPSNLCLRLLSAAISPMPPFYRAPAPSGALALTFSTLPLVRVPSISLCVVLVRPVSTRPNLTRVCLQHCLSRLRPACRPLSPPSLWPWPLRSSLALQPMIRRLFPSCPVSSSAASSYLPAFCVVFPSFVCSTVAAPLFHNVVRHFCIL